ncbi:DUF397 domain-containing protein [Streptomyces carminius]|uniref:DUF397 domain-containing protein n=2 Tax=Streptomyces carminius TaxID=2665496 RepID=A0A2M8LS46_9ACTN|nr:DUF397 domain-containing protein [Streptomyces carminius]
MPAPGTEWFKSSHSMQNGDCVEARRVRNGMEIRDSKRADSPRLRLGADSWTVFLTGVRQEI